MADDTPDSRDMSRWAVVKRAATAGPLPAEHEINQDDIDGFLLEAVVDGNIDRVRYLLTRHPRPRADSRDKALDLASWNNHVVIMQLLVNVGPAALSTTALKYATLGSSLEAITYLVGSSKDPLTYVNSFDEEERTALHYALRHGMYGGYQEKTVRYLIDLGADAALKDSQGRSPAHYACDRPEVPLNVLKLLIRKAGSSIDDQDLDGNTYLHLASRANKGESVGESVEWLLANGANAALKDSQGRSPAHYACDRPEVPLNVLKLLIRKAGSSIDDQDLDGNTYLHLVSRANKGESVGWLLANGAKSSTTDRMDQTAWELAVECCSFDAVGRFAYEEVEYRARSDEDSRVYNSKSYRGEWHDIRAGNIKMLVYGQLARLDKRKYLGWSLQEIIGLVNQTFHEENTSSKILGIRDTSCIFENSKENGPVVDEKEEFEPSFISLVMPFFNATSLEALRNRSGISKKLMQSQYCCCEDPASLGIHLPRTLDEYCYPSLDTPTLDIRNRDQVVIRYQEKSKSWSEESPSVVTVPQAWLWKFDNVIMTALPSDIDVLNPLHTNMMQSWDMYRRFKNVKPEEALGLFLSDLVDVLDRPAMAGLSEPIFNIFEKAIAGLSERVDKYTQSPDVNSIKMVEEKIFLHEIDDIREELSMIKTVLFQQEEVWRDFANKAWPLYWPDGPGGRFKPLPETPDGRVISETERRAWIKIQRPLIQFAKFNRRIAKLDEDAERVERAIDRKLDLKTKHASLREAHTMAIMSAAVFGFTIITIIFTPLSFVVTLFALPIDRFQKQQIPSVWTDQAGMYSTNYMGKWIVTAELVSISLTLTIMWFMVEYGLRVPITDRIKKWAQGMLKGLLNKIQKKEGDETPPASPRAGNAGKSAGEGQSKKKAKVSIDPSDPEDGSKKHQPRRRKWFSKREKSKPDEEEGTENGKHPDEK
ncbi:hypothetical protein G7Y89_g5196 [Cudoniella acicularis]|uniref:Ankyrin repeat protein n=1 Tax=Cudoniella acicularis TaxID=354080 RepID=A0A8H4RPA4_9HELO|nr:hypothetical protein G7Y89_g5196 [Cudoniella acicularis]